MPPFLRNHLVNRIATLLLSVLVPAGCALADSPIAPFKAEYATLRNGHEIARTTIEWKRNGDASWTLRTTTRGTSSLAKMAGLDVAEESVLRWNGVRPETTRYDFRQDMAFKNKRRHGEFDWDAGEVHMVEGDSDARYGLVPFTIDRHALTIALAADLAGHADTFNYKVATKDAIDDVRYTPCGEVKLDVPAGSFSTRCLERVRKKRTSTSWFAAANGWIPVQIEQVERKGDTVTLQLLSRE